MGLGISWSRALCGGTDLNWVTIASVATGLYDPGLLRYAFFRSSSFWFVHPLPFGNGGLRDLFCCFLCLAICEIEKIWCRQKCLARLHEPSEVLKCEKGLEDLELGLVKVKYIYIFFLAELGSWVRAGVFDL